MPATVSRLYPFTAAHGFSGARAASDAPDGGVVAFFAFGNAAVIDRWPSSAAISGTVVARPQDAP